MKLLEIGIGNYRSIGDTPIRINLEKKLNVFIGANNSGKSNVLHALEWITQHKALNNNLEQIEQHQRDAKNSLHLTLKAKLEPSDELEFFSDEEFILDFRCRGQEREWIAGPLDNVDLNVINKFRIKYFNVYFSSRPNEQQLADALNLIDGRIVFELINQLPNVFFIPQFRQITPGGQYSFKGTGIIEMLASWQHPEITLDSNIERFIKIQDLLRRLLNMPDVEMEVVHTKDQIIVKNGDLCMGSDL
ncbi:MAG: AAA family ATPase [Candidatus Hodarchaeales archaeon]|jgi:hypothetical protein